MLSRAFVFLALSACAPPAHPVVGEIYYDAIGDDTGREFVEIFNPGAAAFPLQGSRLESGDGSGPGRWTLRWTGATRDTIPAHGRFVIGGARVEPMPQAIVSLDLQNGPDAVRVVWPDHSVEVVGYGAHEFAEYFCGAAAIDVAAGQSLARVPDDSDLGSNALDFRAAPPTPGRPNQVDHDIAWIPGSLALTPEQPAVGHASKLAGLAVNRGRVAIARGGVHSRAIARGEFGGDSLSNDLIDVALAPFDTSRIEISLAGLREGKQMIEWVLTLEGDERPENDVDSIAVRVGPGPLEPTEIQFHPARGEGEWVEVRNRSADPIDPSAFTLSDRTRTIGRPQTGRAVIASDSLLVLAQNREALLEFFPDLDSTRVWRVSPWPSLNNSDAEDGIADAIVLRDSDGTQCARFDYSAAGVPAGVSLERSASGEWLPSTEPYGSPLRPPRALPAITGRFRLGSRRLTPTHDAVLLEWSLPWPSARIAADLYDLAGAPVATVLPERVASARGEREWRPSGVPPGAYLLRFRARPEPTGEGLSVTRWIRIDGRP